MLIDQIPPLSDLRKTLDNLAIFDPPVPTAASVASAVMIQQISEIRENLVKGIDWQSFTLQTAAQLLELSEEERVQHIQSYTHSFCCNNS